MHHTQPVWAFGSAAVLMAVNLYVHLRLARRSSSPQERSRIMLRVAVINSVILLAAVAYVVTHR